MNMNRKYEKQIQADERNEYFAALTPEQQIESLDKRLGKDVGAVKQRAKIAAKIAASKAPAKTAKAETTSSKKNLKGKAAKKGEV
jgi:hypothetical protein